MDWSEYRNLSRQDWQIVKLPLWFYWLLLYLYPVFGIAALTSYSSCHVQKSANEFPPYAISQKRKIKRWIRKRVWHCLQHILVYPSRSINVTIDYNRSNIRWFTSTALHKDLLPTKEQTLTWRTWQGKKLNDTDT